jgi:hypothetical protein
LKAQTSCDGAFFRRARGPTKLAIPWQQFCCGCVGRANIPKDIVCAPAPLHTIPTALPRRQIGEIRLPQVVAQSELPIITPISLPSNQPSESPCVTPSLSPSKSSVPSLLPSVHPSSIPSNQPIESPSSRPCVSSRNSTHRVYFLACSQALAFSLPSSCPNSQPSNQPRESGFTRFHKHSSLGYLVT